MGGGLKIVLESTNWGLEQMRGWKIEHMDNAKNKLGKMTNHELSIKSKVTEIIVVV